MNTNTNNKPEDGGKSAAPPSKAAPIHINQDIIDILKTVPLLRALNATEVQNLSAKLIRKEFETDGVLMEQGTLGNEFFIITEGECQVLVNTGEETEAVAKLCKGDYCGEHALMSEEKRNATIKATCPTTCLVLNRAGFQDLLGNKVRFAKREAKRRAIATENLDNFEIDENKETPKQAEIEWLVKCVHENILFERLSADQQKTVVKHMYKEKVPEKHKLIEQGSEGNKFYVVESGEFDIHVESVGFVEGLTRGSCTGELALMYDAPRAATVTSKTEAVVWVMERRTFRKALMNHNKAQTHQNIEFLKRVELLQPLLSSEISLVDQALQEQTFNKGDVIFKQGQAGDNFYILLKGACKGERVKGDGTVEVFDLAIGNFFGERALLTDENRAATISCVEDDTVCLWLPRAEFVELLGPLTEIMNRNIEEYEKPEQERNLIGQVQQGDFCDLADFRTVGILGKGAFGTVTLVVDPKTSKSYALKAIRKIQIVELGQQTHICNEKKVMTMLDSDFLVNLRNTYKDQWRVYFLLDVCLGGELFTVLRKMRSFDEPTSKFFSGCVVEAFDYMHSLNVIYRDLKPENLVLAKNGYLKVTDFGFAKVVVNKTFTLCGTPDYLAPEIVTGQGHGKGVDWWTLGVLIYEMMASFPPFYDEEPMMTYRKIISCKYKFPKYLSPTAKDIIASLLKPRPTKRLGVMKGGARMLHNHQWYKNFNWDNLRSGKMRPPFVPEVRSEDDISNFEKYNDEKEPLEFDDTQVDMSWDEIFN